MDILTEKLDAIFEAYESEGISSRDYDDALLNLITMLGNPLVEAKVRFIDQNLNDFEEGVHKLCDDLQEYVAKAWENIGPGPQLRNVCHDILKRDLTDIHNDLKAMRDQRKRLLEAANMVARHIERSWLKGSWRIIAAGVTSALRVAQIKIPFVHDQAAIYMKRLTPDILSEMAAQNITFDAATSEDDAAEENSVFFRTIDR